MPVPCADIDEGFCFIKTALCSWCMARVCFRMYFWPRAYPSTSWYWASKVPWSALHLENGSITAERGGESCAQVRMICDALFGRRQSQGGDFSWKLNNVDPSDLQACERLLAEMRDYSAGRGFPLAVSPLHFLRIFPQSIMVLPNASPRSEVHS